VTSDESATTVNVAVVQAGSVPFDTGACIEKAVRLIGEAAATGARVIVFPEAFITGYPKGLNYGLVVGARDAVGREEFRLYLEAAIDVPGPETLQLGKTAAAHGCEIPDLADREHINSIIFNELVQGECKEDSRRYFQDVIEKLETRGCDAVVLACTEIPLLISEADSRLRVIDSTRTLARAALREATQSVAA
jgi:Carbon-nitrogen hydrolase/Asp/Glu/Hydantoin racemase